MLRIVPSTSRAISLNPKSVSPFYAGLRVVACISQHTKGESVRNMSPFSPRRLLWTIIIPLVIVVLFIAFREGS